MLGDLELVEPLLKKGLIDGPSHHLTKIHSAWQILHITYTRNCKEKVQVKDGDVLKAI